MVTTRAWLVSTFVHTEQVSAMNRRFFDVTWMSQSSASSRELATHEAATCAIGGGCLSMRKLPWQLAIWKIHVNDRAAPQIVNDNQAPAIGTRRLEMRFSGLCHKMNDITDIKNA